MGWWDKVKEFWGQLRQPKPVNTISKMNSDCHWELIQGNCLEILDKLFEEKGEFVAFNILRSPLLPI